MTRKYKPRMTKFDKKMGSKIRKLRKEIGLTQEKLADKLNITAQHLCYIENGKRRPSLKLLMKISRKFNVKVEDLFHR